jgi:hypothetical protein
MNLSATWRRKRPLSVGIAVRLPEAAKGCKEAVAGRPGREIVG